MTLYVDPRAGSKGLMSPLREMGARVKLKQMQFGDVAFEGKVKGKPWRVGIEYKKLSDVLQCITTGRYAGTQLPGLQENYDEAWLLVEGFYRPADARDCRHPFAQMQRDDLLILRKKKWEKVPWGKQRRTYEALTHWLLTMAIRGGVPYVRTLTPWESAAWIYHLYTWWSSGLEAHKAHLAFDESGQSRGRRNVLRQRIALVKPSITQEMFSRLPGVGYEKSSRVGKRFRTMMEAVLAEPSEWMQVPGVGRKIAEQCLRILQRGG